ncbi:MAG: Do family serine endopeptidase [Gammaproteobacteria bacterium]|nr:Do family serine endopeptidase [Gammaproteobacteria bacterium]
MSRNKALSAAIAATLVPAMAAGYLLARSPAAASAPAAPPAAAGPTVALPDIAALVTQASPAVVAVRVTGTLHDTALQGLPPGIDPNSPLYDFLHRFGIPDGGGGGGEAMPTEGIGSGFIITPDGYIFTNAHVVKDADEVTVRLADKREFKAKVVGVDLKSDVAVIKIDATHLPTLHIGDPKTLRVGEWVAAIGSPFGLENTVTAGVVSAKARALPDDSYVPFIQTDVAVNPGNSGGPLLNMKGEVVGINSQIYSRTGGYMGLSFAIPIDVAMKVGDELRHDGKVEHGRLGVSVQSMTQDLAQSFGMDKPVGALVSAVEDGSPAQKAGLKSGDVILGIDGKAVDDSITLSRIVADMRPGDRATLRVRRHDGEQMLTATIGESADSTIADSGSGGGKAATGRLGVAVRSLSDAERERIGDSGGVLVEEVAGAAAKAGIRPGDVILAVNQDKVRDPADLRRMVENAHGHVALLVKRDEAEIYVPVAIG